LWGKPKKKGGVATRFICPPKGGDLVIGTGRLQQENRNGKGLKANDKRENSHGIPDLLQHVVAVPKMQFQPGGGKVGKTESHRKWVIGGWGDRGNPETPKGRVEKTSFRL